MFVRIAIDRVIQKIGADSAVIQQGISLSGRTIPCNELSFTFGCDKEFEQFALRLFDLFTEGGIMFHFREPGIDLSLVHFLCAVREGERLTFSMPPIDAQGAAMCREFLHIEQGNTMCGKYLFGSDEAKI